MEGGFDYVKVIASGVVLALIAAVGELFRRVRSNETKLALVDDNIDRVEKTIDRMQSILDNNSKTMAALEALLKASVERHESFQNSQQATNYELRKSVKDVSDSNNLILQSLARQDEHMRSVDKVLETLSIKADNITEKIEAVRYSVKTVKEEE